MRGWINAGDLGKICIMSMSLGLLAAALSLSRQYSVVQIAHISWRWK